jgi:hypothetical protein
MSAVSALKWPKSQPHLLGWTQLLGTPTNHDQASSGVPPKKYRYRKWRKKKRRNNNTQVISNGKPTTYSLSACFACNASDLIPVSLLLVASGCTCPSLLVEKGVLVEHLYHFRRGIDTIHRSTEFGDKRYDEVSEQMRWFVSAKVQEHKNVVGLFYLATCFFDLQFATVARFGILTLHNFFLRM